MIDDETKRINRQFEEEWIIQPVAYVDKIWIERPDLVKSHQLEIGKLFWRYHPSDNTVALYAENKVKDITQEDIYKLAEYHGVDSLYEFGVYDFVLDILKKARE
jgi:hypothetical protein